MESSRFDHAWVVPTLTTISRGQLPGLVVFIVGPFALYFAALAIYRLFFHPLAKFPGPVLARATYIPERYHDVWRPGMYIYEIEKMHAKYGPIVRLNPDELSIKDAMWYDQLYVGAHVRKTNMYAGFVGGIDLGDSHFLTNSHDLHKARRKALDPFFSRFGTRKLEPLLQSLAVRFEKNLRAHAGQVVLLDRAFLCYTGDVIRSITCEDIDYFMDDPEYSPEWFNLILTATKNVPLFCAFPTLIQIVNLVPQSVLEWLCPAGIVFRKYKNMARSHIVRAKADKKIADSQGTKVMEGSSVIRSLINSNMSESEASVERLTKEAEVLFGAGTITPARTLDFVTYYIVADPELRTRLGDELKDAMADYPNKFPSQAELEQLPVLSATVKEGLRLSYGIMHRLTHCYPDEDIRYKGWIIPRNTPIGMSAYYNHTDPAIFTDPFKFNPDRWLGEIDPCMEKAFVPFSRGSRNCLASSLGMTEITYVLAAMFRPDGPIMTLYETDESDVVPIHDFLAPLPKLDTKGVRVMVH